MENIVIDYGTRHLTVLGGNSYKITVTKNKLYKKIFYISAYTTGNCQMLDIGRFNTLLNSSSNFTDDIIAYIIDTSCRSITGRTRQLVHFDFSQVYKERFLRIYKPLFINDYESTNGSDMCMGLFRTDIYADNFKLKQE